MLRPGGRLLLSDTVAPEDQALDSFINQVEKLRDPTHVRDYTVSEWRDVLNATGLAVEQSELFLKTIPFDDWCVRARVPEHVRAELRRRLLGASPEEREAFAVTVLDGEVESFALHAVIIRAVKESENRARAGKVAPQRHTGHEDPYSMDVWCSVLTIVCLCGEFGIRMHSRLFVDRFGYVS